MIIDTDASFDVDDVVAICLAHALQDRGEAEIRAIVHDAGIPEGIGAVSVLNHFYGRDDILLGAYKGNFGKDPNNNGWVRGAYVDDLVNNWDSPIRDSSQVMEATEVYRKVLANYTTFLFPEFLIISTYILGIAVYFIFVLGFSCFLVFLGSSGER